MTDQTPEARLAKDEDGLVIDCEYGQECVDLMDALVAHLDRDKARWWGIYGSYRKAAHDILTIIQAAKEAESE